MHTGLLSQSALSHATGSAGHGQHEGAAAAGLKALTLGDCRNRAPEFAEIIRAVAQERGIDPRALAVRTLLHLPRIAGSGRISARRIMAEARRAADDLRADLQAAERAQVLSGRALPLALLKFAPVDASRADVLFGTLHYLRSARPGSLNFGLVDPDNGLPVTICSVSPMAWRRVANYIHRQAECPRERVWEVSRVYSSDCAPHNAISRLLAGVRDQMRRTGAAEVLATAVDPNLGFTGTSYRAANWQEWLTVQPRPYLYCDGRYTSPRQLRERFKTSSLEELRVQQPGHLFEQSRVRLLGPRIFCCCVRSGARSGHQQSVHLLHR